MARDGLKSVLIIHTDGNTFNNPSLKCIIDLLLEKGCSIDLRYPKSNAPMPTLPGVRLLPFGRRLRRYKSIVFDRLCSWSAAYVFVLLEKCLVYDDYDLVIGVDRQGLIEAGILNGLARIPFVFVSFEIMFESETSRRYKSLEKKAAKRAAAWLVQDRLRAADLQRENLLAPEKCMFLPLASAGRGVFKKPRLRDRLGVPEDKMVAMIMGSLDKWTMAMQVLQCVADWPDQWVVVVHERYGRTHEVLSAHLAGFANLVNRKIFVSDQATEMVDDLGGVLAGVSLGIALYDPQYGLGYTGRYLGRNLKNLGLASGKISTYLRYGIPVVVNQIGLYAEEAQRFGFGWVVNAPDEIVKCLRLVDDPDCRNRAVDYFEDKLDFSVFRDRVWVLLDTARIGA